MRTKVLLKRECCFAEIFLISTFKTSIAHPDRDLSRRPRSSSFGAMTPCATLMLMGDLDTPSELRMIFPDNRAGWKALTVQDAPSIRPSMAAGAIPPPLFFEQRRHESICSRSGLPLEHPNNIPASIARRNCRLAKARPPGDRSLPKDI